jgi:tetratricopeptide (TPR) repeat protein
MDHKSNHDFKEDGKKTWYALENQWAEAVGFFNAMFLSFVKAVQKHFWGFFVFAVVVGATGAAYAWLKKDVYKSQMTVSYAQLEKKIYGDMLYKLNELLESQQYAETAQLLKLKEEKVEDIKSIKGINIHGQLLTEDLSVEKVPFYIEVVVFNPKLLPDLEVSLVQYISQSKYVEERLKLNENNYKKEIRHLQNQLAYMDSLKIILMSDCADLKGDVVENLNQLNESQNEIFSQIRDFESALLFNKNIEVMDGFIAHHESKTKVILKFLFIGLAVGIGFRLVYLIFK